MIIVSKSPKGTELDENKRTGWNPLKGIILLLFMLGLAGIAFFFWKYDDVFPAASVNLKLSKAEIASRAREFSKLTGYDPANAIESTTFQERGQTATFLEHEYSMREANKLMESDISVFYWYSRFCRPQEEEECQVWLNTDGKLAGLNRDIEKEREMPSISQKEARLLALKFVKEQAGISLFKDNAEPGKELQLSDGIKLIRQGSTKQLNRTDHYFTWEDESRDYKGGHIRTTVDVSGNQVTAYDRELHVPESFERRFADIRSYNDLFKSISSILFAVVGTGMGVAFIWALSSGRLRVRLVLVAAVITFFVEFLDYWNNWPAILQAYSTTESFQGFLTGKLVSSLLTCVTASLAATVLVGGIEAVYRHKFPKMIAAEHVLNWRNLNNKTLLESIIAGICVFGIHLGYVAAYYLIGTKMGMWSPLEVRDVTTMSNISPAFSSFAVGVNASVSEELLYRVLCFVIAQRVFKNFWIANFIQAVGWAFMHSDYPQEPAYARGLELTIVGVFYGYLFRRFGVLPGIISHFIYDAFLGVTPLLLSQSIVLSATGILACLPPFLALGIGLLGRARKAEEVPDEKLLNENLVQPTPHVPEPAHEERHLIYRPLSAKMKAVLLMACLFMTAACVLLQPRKMGNWAKVTASKAQIEEVARKFLKERGVTEGDWKVNCVLSSNIDDEEVQYGFEKLGYDKTEKIMRSARIPLLWWVRFYKPHQRREYGVFLSSDGRPLALQVTEEEDAGGKELSEEEARRITEDFIKQYRPEFLPLTFDSAAEQKRKNRTDYAVSYEVPDFKMGDARLKVSVDTVGSLVSFPRVSWDIPDAWRFERGKLTTKDHVAKAASQITFAVLLVFFGIWATGVFRAQAIHWRPALITAAIVALSSLLNQVNELSYNLTGYDTDVPFMTFLTQLAVKGIISAIFYGALFAALITIGHGAFRILFPGVTLESLWHSTVRPPEERKEETRKMWTEGALAAYAWVFTFNALAVMSSFLAVKYSPEAQVQSLQALVNATHFSSPALEQIVNCLTIGFATMCIVPALVGLYLKYFRSFGRYLLISMLVLMVIESTTKHWQDYIVEVAIGGVELVAVYCWIRYCARNNPIAYFLAGALNSLIVSIYYLFRFSNNVYSLDLCVMAACFAMPLFIPLIFRRGNGNGKPSDAGESLRTTDNA